MLPTQPRRPPDNTPNETIISNNINYTWYTMAKASIGVSPAVKKTLEAAKPEGMPWNQFFETLLQSADPERFLQTAEAMGAATEAEAIERARARYQHYRAHPEEALSGTQLRSRIHLRRLLDSLEAFRGALRVAAANPAADPAAIDAALAGLDAQIHDTRGLLAA